VHKSTMRHVSTRASISVYMPLLHLIPHHCGPASSTGLPPPAVPWESNAPEHKANLRLQHTTNDLAPSRVVSVRPHCHAPHCRPHNSGGAPLCGLSSRQEHMLLAHHALTLTHRIHPPSLPPHLLDPTPVTHYRWLLLTAPPNSAHTHTNPHPHPQHRTNT